MASLCCRRNLTTVDNVCEAVPVSLFWDPNGLIGSPEVHLECPFILIGKSKMAFLTGQLCCILKSKYTGGGQNKDFNAVSLVDLTRVKFCVWRRLHVHVASVRNSMFFLLVGLHCLNTSCHSLGFMADKSPVLPWQGCYFTGHVKCICHGAILFNGRSLCLLQNVFYWWSLWLHDGCFNGFLHSPCKEMSTPGMFVNVL